jgi:hypothetical protein
MKELKIIAQMVGRTYLYKKEQYTILTYFPEGEAVRLKTDSKDIVLLNDGLQHSLGLFLEVEPEQTAALQPLQSSSTLSELHAVLMDTIRKVQADKEYVPQAAQINKTVTAATNLLKAEMDFFRLTKSQNKP